MGTITTLDLFIIAAYLVGMLLIGFLFTNRIKGSNDYYVAGRTLGPLVLTATVCATIIGGSAMMGRAGLGYTSGIECVMTAIPYMLGMFLFSALAGKIQRIGCQHNVTSIPELFSKRFNNASRCLLAVLITFAMMGTVASQVSATATIIKLVGGGIGITYETGALIATVIFIIYTAASGLFGVVYTDVLQFFMLIIFVYLLIPIRSTIELGGLGNFWAGLDKSLLVPKVNGSIAGDILTYLVFTLAGAEMWQRAFAAKDAKSAKRGMFFGTAIYGVTVVLVLFMGLAARQILPNVAETYGTTDAVVPALAITMLPSGLTGLALAGILSVMMSTSDSYLLVSVQTCIHDIGKVIKPDMTEKRELLLSRLFTVLLAMSSLIIALYIKSAYYILTFAWSFYAAAAGLPAFAALYWKKATSAGILSAMIGGLATCVLWRALGQPFGLGATIPGAVVCGILLVTVSLTTYKKSPSVFLEVENTK